ncbi:MAG: alpha/beta hydrolase family protein [bacterium]
MAGIGLGLLLGGCDEAEHVRFRNGEIALAGEVWKPKANGQFPAVVFVHGSSASARDEFHALAKLLAEQGLVSLLYDMRGTGNFSGEWTGADFQAFAGEALAAVQYLQQRPDIQKTNTGLAGFGNGGLVALLAASASPDIAFVITVSTPAVSPHEPGGFDPLPVLRNLHAPVLTLFGERDDSTTVENSVALITAVMRETGRRNLAFRVLPNADRDLYTKPYHDSPLPLLQNLPLSRRFEPEALEAMVYWIKVVSPLHRTQAKK